MSDEKLSNFKLQKPKRIKYIQIFNAFDVVKAEVEISRDNCIRVFVYPKAGQREEYFSDLNLNVEDKFKKNESN